jgi:hypothetical protein
VARFAPHAKPNQTGNGRDQRETQYAGCARRVPSWRLFSGLGRWPKSGKSVG